VVGATLGVCAMRSGSALGTEALATGSTATGCSQHATQLRQQRLAPASADAASAFGLAGGHAVYQRI
jgi:hypothetical protein